MQLRRAVMRQADILQPGCQGALKQGGGLLCCSFISVLHLSLST